MQLPREDSGVTVERVKPAEQEAVRRVPTQLCTVRLLQPEASISNLIYVCIILVHISAKLRRNLSPVSSGVLVTVKSMIYSNKEYSVFGNLCKTTDGDNL